MAGWTCPDKNKIVWDGDIHAKGFHGESGTITKVPTNIKDIANKKYVDDSIGSDHPHQDVQTTASPTFAHLSVIGFFKLGYNAGGYGLYLYGEVSAFDDDYVLEFVTGNANRTLTLTGNAVLNQDVSTAGSPTFGDTNVIGNILAGNITEYTELYSGYTAQNPQIIEVGYGTETAAATPFPIVVISKNMTDTSDGTIGALAFANIGATGNKGIAYIEASTDGTLNKGAIKFRVNNGTSITDALIIKSDSKVGIKKMNPSADLHIYNADTHCYGIWESGEDSGGWLGYFGSGSSDPAIFWNTGKDLRFGTNTAIPTTGWSEKMRIDTDGNVGINDTSPASKLDVTGDINTTEQYKVDDVQVVSNRVIDARCDDAVNSGDATTDGVIDALRDAMITHGLIAAS